MVVKMAAVTEAPAISGANPLINTTLEASLFSSAIPEVVDSSADHGPHEEVEPPLPAENPEPASHGPKFPEKAWAATKDAAFAVNAFVLSATGFPIWAFLLIFAIVAPIIVVIYWYIKHKWRLFKKTEKGHEIVTKMAEHEFLGKFVQPPTKFENVELDTLAENEEIPENEEGGEEDTGDEPLGTLHYRLEYDFEKSNLMVSILAAKDLKAMDSGGTSDSYVKVFFAGDKKKKFETKVHRKMLSPEYKETFTYKNIDFLDVMAKLLMIQVFDFDRFSSHDEIGELRIKLCTIDLSTPWEEWKDLVPPLDEDSALGDICLSLRYVPTTQKLTICIIECKSLKNMDFGGLSDPFVKINMYIDGKKVGKKKTSVKAGTLNPYFNESFVFIIPEKDLKKVHFFITAHDYDRIGTCDPIGRTSVGSNQEGAGLQHWREMVNNPRRPISQWHTLRDVEEFKEPEVKDK